MARKRLERLVKIQREEGGSGARQRIRARGSTGPSDRHRSGALQICDRQNASLKQSFPPFAGALLPQFKPLHRRFRNAPGIAGPRIRFIGWAIHSKCNGSEKRRTFEPINLIRVPAIPSWNQISRREASGRSQSKIHKSVQMRQKYGSQSV